MDDLVNLRGRRRVVAAALAVTTGVLAAGAVRPTPRRLSVAVALNAGWVVAGLSALPWQPDRRGSALVAAVVAGDAVACGLQWFLRRR